MEYVLYTRYILYTFTFSLSNTFRLYLYYLHKSFMDRHYHLFVDSQIGYRFSCRLPPHNKKHLKHKTISYLCLKCHMTSNFYKWLTENFDPIFQRAKFFLVRFCNRPSERHLRNKFPFSRDIPFLPHSLFNQFRIVLERCTQSFCF